MRYRLCTLLHFRLSTLLIVVTLFGGWPGFQVNRANRQKRAVAEIQAMLGVATYDYERDGSGNSIANAEPPGPRWLRKLIGDDYFCGVAIVDLTYDYRRRNQLGLSVDDNWLRCLGSLPSVHKLEIGHARDVTDAGLVHLRDLKQLRMLYLYDTNVTGTGFIHLANLPHLAGLDLRWAPLTHDGIVGIKQLEHLEVLGLAETPITDDDLAALKPLANLKSLRLEKTSMTDQGLTHLASLVSLEELELPAGIFRTMG